MKNGDWPYLAGIIDGEGGISIVKREGSRKESYSVRLSIYNTYLPLITWLKDELGGCITSRKRGPRRLISYTITWNHKQASKIIESTMPYLKIKSKQAAVALRLQAISSTNNLGRKGLSEDRVASMLALKLQINALNSKEYA